jgi:prolyl-tRNA editing enzyme YbaK/EbsC (Cys-tRNA(Pro) deacylase)
VPRPERSMVAHAPSATATQPRPTPLTRPPPAELTGTIPTPTEKASADEDAALRALGLSRTRAAAEVACQSVGAHAAVAAAYETAYEAATGREGTAEETMAASEINSLCFSAGAAGPLLVLYPADERVDTRWLALVLGVPRKKVRRLT